MREKRIRVEKFIHPELKNRYVSVLFIDDKLDIPSFLFLCKEAVSGGRKNQPAAKTSYSGRAYKIAELYDHLHDKGLDWQTAEEEDIREIRNAMLHWDINDRYAPEYYTKRNIEGGKEFLYERIENDTMNQKLSVWFKFYKYQMEKKSEMKMHLSTKIIEISISDAYLQHLYGKTIGKNKLIVERWDLMVKSSAKKLYFPAINKIEYEAFKTHLLRIDPVYAAIAELAVSTGLRKQALLDVDPLFFKGIIKDVSQGGQTMENGFRTMTYENKGGTFEKCKVPLQTILEIKNLYITSEYEDRKNRHYVKYGHDEKYMWFREDGKRIEYYDLCKAFAEASISMGRNLGIDNITPHHLRHTYATWTVLDGAKVLGIDLVQLDAKLVPGLIYWVQMQLAHISAETTTKYIVSAILMIIPKSTGPLISSNMLNKGKVFKDILKSDAKLYFGADFNPNKFNEISWAKFRKFYLDSELMNSLL